MLTALAGASCASDREARDDAGAGVSVGADRDASMRGLDPPGGGPIGRAASVDGDDGDDGDDGLAGDGDGTATPVDGMLAAPSRDGQQFNCAPTVSSRPVDVIFVIDTSGSMGQEIAATKANINDNFAAILEDANVDYRVIMIAAYPASDGMGDPATPVSNSELSICVGEPLAPVNCNAPPREPTNGERFFHYHAPIGSFDSFCEIQRTFSRADPFNHAPGGWSGWLRPNAFKVFVEVSDDAPVCLRYEGEPDVSVDATPEEIAEVVDRRIRELDPDLFGTAEQRGYTFYSIVGISLPAGPADPIVETTCATAPNVAARYQALSILTEGRRYPVCEGLSFSSAFRDIAGDVEAVANCFPPGE